MKGSDDEVTLVDATDVQGKRSAKKVVKLNRWKLCDGQVKLVVRAHLR